MLDFGKITETRFFGFMCHLTYAPATLRRRLKNLVSVGSLPPFSVFAKLQFKCDLFREIGYEALSTLKRSATS